MEGRTEREREKERRREKENEEEREEGVEGEGKGKEKQKECTLLGSGQKPSQTDRGKENRPRRYEISVNYIQTSSPEAECWLEFTRF